METRNSEPPILRFLTQDENYSTLDLCKTPICSSFLRCALLARLPIYLICLHSLCCYALNCIHI